MTEPRKRFTISDEVLYDIPSRPRVMRDDSGDLWVQVSSDPDLFGWVGYIDGALHLVDDAGRINGSGRISGHGSFVELGDLTRVPAFQDRFDAAVESMRTQIDAMPAHERRRIDIIGTLRKELFGHDEADEADGVRTLGDRLGIGLSSAEDFAQAVRGLGPMIDGHEVNPEDRLWVESQTLIGAMEIGDNHTVQVFFDANQPFAGIHASPGETIEFERAAKIRVTGRSASVPETPRPSQPSQPFRASDVAAKTIRDADRVLAADLMLKELREQTGKIGMRDPLEYAADRLADNGWRKIESKSQPAVVQLSPTDRALLQDLRTQRVDPESGARLASEILDALRSKEPIGPVYCGNGPSFAEGGLIPRGVTAQQFDAAVEKIRLSSGTRQVTYGWRTDGVVGAQFKKVRAELFGLESPESPELPTEPGFYLDKDRGLWQIDGHDRWFHLTDSSGEILLQPPNTPLGVDDFFAAAPFTRLGSEDSKGDS